MNSKLKKRNILTSEYIASVTGQRGINLLNDYNKADEEERRDSLLQYPNEIMKTPELRKSKYYTNAGSSLTSQQLWLH